MKLGVAIITAALTLGYSLNASADELKETEEWKISPDRKEDSEDIPLDIDTPLEEHKEKKEPENKQEDEEWSISPDEKEPEYEFRKTSLLEATLITGIPALAASVAYLSFYARDHDITGKQVCDNYVAGFKKPFTFDNNPWYINYVGHPVFGSEAYLLCRNRGHHPIACFMYAGAASTVWEYAIENSIGMPSIQDQLFTPVWGTVLGEGRFQAKVELWKMGNRRNTFEDILMVLLDPNDAFYRFVENQR